MELRVRRTLVRIVKQLIKLQQDTREKHNADKPDYSI